MIMHYKINIYKEEKKNFFERSGKKKKSTLEIYRFQNRKKHGNRFDFFLMLVIFNTSVFMYRRKNTKRKYLYVQ